MKTFTELKKFVMDLDDDVRDMYSIDQEIVEIMDSENPVSYTHLTLPTMLMV